MAATTNKPDGARPDPASLAAGHATGTLSEAERRRLYRAALSDQEVFDQLVEEESWRRIFDAPGVRGELLAALAESSADSKPLRKEGWRRWLDGLWRPLWRPVPWTLGTAAAALLVAVLVPRWLEVGVPGPVAPPPVAGDPVAADPARPAPVADPVAPAPGSAEPVAPAPAEPAGAVSEAPPAVETPATELVPKSFGPPPPAGLPTFEPGTRSLRPKSAGGARSLGYTLELNSPDGPRPVPDGYAFRPGDQFRLRLGVDFTAWLYLFNRAAGEDAYAVLYPSAEREREPRPPSETEFLLPAGVWLTLDDTPEDEQLVLVASARPWPAARSGAVELPAAELDAALEQAESRFQALSWRRSEAEDRVRWTVGDSGDDLILVVRLLSSG